MAIRAAFQPEVQWSASADDGQQHPDLRRHLYTDDGRLLWDADGTGNDAAVLVATFTNHPPLAASDFVVV